MEHVTALVDHDATTPFICACARYAEAGWRVNCSACGRSEFSLEDLDEIDDALAEGPPWSSIDPDDVERDAELVDEAERRVA